MRGSSTLCKADARGSRLKVWKTKPISLLRIRASASSARSETFWPLSQYSPPVGVSRQPIRFMSVDFPGPDGPIRTPGRSRGLLAAARVGRLPRRLHCGSVVQVPDRLIGSGDDRLVLAQAVQHLEILVARDSHLHRSERRLTVLDHEHALRLLLLTRGRGVAPDDGRAPARLRADRSILPHRERDD